MLLLTVALTLVSCNRKTIYSHYEHTSIDGWEQTDTLTFIVSPVAKTGTYIEEVGLRINDAYPFTGLTLVVEQKAFPSGIARSDTLNARLVADNGTRLGKGINLYQYNYHLCNLPLQQDDSLRITLYHHMKRQLLPGIADIGITLRRVE